MDDNAELDHGRNLEPDTDDELGEEDEGDYGEVDARTAARDDFAAMASKLRRRANGADVLEGPEDEDDDDAEWVDKKKPRSSSACLRYGLPFVS